MSRGEQPAPEEYEQALRDAISAALAEQPSGSARVVEGRNETYPDIWSLEITPARTGAATTSVTFVGGDEIVLGIGETHVYMWDDDPDALGDEVRRVLRAVYAGRLDEGGMRNDARVRVYLDDGTVWRGGSVGLPLPWRWRRLRRYLPLSDGG